MTPTESQLRLMAAKVLDDGQEFLESVLGDCRVILAKEKKKTHMYCGGKLLCNKECSNWESFGHDFHAVTCTTCNRMLKEILDRPRQYRENGGLVLPNGNITLIDLEDFLINHNTLDNRRCNLRVVTTAENGHNMKKRKGTSSKYLNVSRLKSGSYRVSCVRYGKRYYGGEFKNEDDAGRRAKELAAAKAKGLI
jgi:hypothetical protein